jgi:virginiamycin A acetyltransferase
VINIELLNKGLKVTNKALAKIPPSVKIKFRAPCVLGNVELKSHLHIGVYTYFDSGRIGSLHSIGNYCSVAPNCSIGNGNHPTDYLTTHPLGFKAAGLLNFDKKVREYKGGVKRTPEVVKSAPTIGHDVWIGGGVTILRGVKIGNGVIIGANTLVNKDIPDFAIVVGTPMKIVRMRFEEKQIAKLKALNWWEYDIADLPALSFDDIDLVIEQIDEAINSGVLKLISEVRPWQLKEFNN